MAKEDENWKRRRAREDEQDREEAEAIKKSQTGDVQKPVSTLSTDKLFDLLQRAEPLIEQLDHLYGMYFSGAEKLPPLERRKALEQTMTTLQLMNKPTPAAVFRYNSVQSRFAAYKERWDRLLKDLESGKIKRVVGPKR